MAEQATAGTPASAGKKTEYTKVTMEDGSEYEFAGKRKMEKERVIERGPDGAVARLGVKFRFRHGGILMSWIPDNMIADAATHGWGQKLGDTVAGMKDANGNPVDSDDMETEVEGLSDRLTAPGANWNEVREGGGFGGASILARALVIYTSETDRPQTKEQVKEFLSKKSAKEKMALRDKPSRPNKAGRTIQAIIEELEKAKKVSVDNIDTDALMDQLTAGAPAA